MGSKLKLYEVTYFNAEHTKHKVSNLLTGNGKWASPVRFKDELVCEFSLQGPARITRIDLGNYWSASVEISVGLSSWPSSKRELFASHNFMNRITSLSGDNKEQVLTFTGADFKQVSETYWDRVRITCKQPYRCENDCFGLSIVDVSGFLRNSSESSQAADTITSKIDEKDINNFIQQKFNVMKNTPKSSPSRLLSSIQGGFKHSKPSPNSTQQNNEVNDIGQPASKKQGVASSHSIKERTDIIQNTKEEKENKERIETLTPDQFHRKCVRFLEKSLKEYGLEELRLVSYNIIKRLWSAHYGKEVEKSQKKILKIASEEYLVERVEVLEKEVIVPNIQVDETRERPGKRKLSSVGSDEHEGKENKRMNRNSIIDLRDESNQDDENINNNRASTSNSSKKSNETPSRLARRRTSSSKRQRVKSGGKPKPDMKAVPNADGWFSSINPRNSQEAEKTLPLKFTPAVLGYNPSNLLQIPVSELEQAGILFQQYNYQKDKSLPIKDQDKPLVVERLEPVKFFKCGREIFLVYRNRFYDPDVDDDHVERLFKNHQPSKVKNNRPLIKEIKDFINNYGLTAEVAEDQVVTVVDDDENVVEGAENVVNTIDIVEENTNQAERQSSVSGTTGSESIDSGVECPLCMKPFSSGLIQDHAATCDGVDVEDNNDDAGAPMTTCPLCNKSMDPSILQDHAATCTGESDDVSRPSSPAFPRLSSPPLASSTQGPSSSSTNRSTFTFGPSSSVNKSRSSQVISIDDEPDTLVARPLKYGDCPVCKRRMKMEELTEHAMGCQGFALNGGNGLHVNVMDSQARCDFCEQLIPDFVMEEHVEDCPARGIRQRVLTAVEKRIPSNRFKNSWR